MYLTQLKCPMGMFKTVNLMLHVSFTTIKKINHILKPTDLKR